MTDQTVASLTEDEALILDEARELAPPDPDYPIPWDRYLLSRLLAIIDRLSAAPVDNREREGEVLLHGERWRVTWRSPLLGGSIDARLVPVSPSVDPEEEP